MGYLKLNNKLMPTPKLDGVSISHEKIWSKGTTRTSSCKMVGDIKGIKTTIVIEFPPLTRTQIETLNSVLNDASLPFFPCDVYDGSTHLKTTVYSSSPSYKIYSTVNGMRLYTAYKIELVEQ